MRNNTEKETYVALLKRGMMAQWWKCSCKFNTDSVTLDNLLGHLPSFRWQIPQAICSLESFIWVKSFDAWPNNGGRIWAVSRWHFDSSSCPPKKQNQCSPTILSSVEITLPSLVENAYKTVCEWEQGVNMNY